MILLLVFYLLILFFYFYNKYYRYWRSKGIPFDPPVFPFGSFQKVVFRQEHVLDRLRAIYQQFPSPYVGIYIFHHPLLLIRCPDLIKRVLIKDFDKFPNRNIAKNEAADPLAYHTLFMARDNVWRNMRNKFTPVFTPAKMKLMFPLMRECAEELCNYLDGHDAQIIDAVYVLRKFSIDMISSCFFGINGYCFEHSSSKIYEKSLELIDTKSVGRSFSILSYFFIPSFVDIFKLRFLDKTATDFFCDLFEETFEKRKREQIVRNDFMEILKNLRTTQRITDDYKFDSGVKMAAQAIAFFVAGSDAIASSLAIVLYELALDKTIQSQLRHEVRNGFDKHGAWTFEMVNEMKYLDMVLKETLRKYPLTPFLNRRAQTDYVLDHTGSRIDEGTTLMIPIVGLHYDPELYPEPEKYDPERFRDESKIKPYTYLPFGGGPRGCIGQRFTMIALKVGLAAVIKDFEFDITPKTSVPMRFDTGSIFVQIDGSIFLKASRI